MKIPAPLHHGDRIAIISPASVVNPGYISGAAALLADAGFEPVVFPHANGPASGSYAAADAERLADITDALANDSIRAILCARGGYGCNHLLDKIPAELIAGHPKWIIGFSDVSALHALWNAAGVASLHAPMAKHLATLPPDHCCTRHLLTLLRTGNTEKYVVPAHSFNLKGEARGILRGGNLAVINGLADTPYDVLARPENTILFIEDISEKIYAVERMLIRMILSGKLQRIAGLIVGRFTDYGPDRNHPDMETMISQLLDGLPEVHFPVAFNFPAGHIDDNLPLMMGAETVLTVGDDEASVRFEI